MRIYSIWVVVIIVIAGISYFAGTHMRASDGKIHHPVYGEYAETVEFEQGMTLMPGQTATGTIEIPLQESN